MFSQDTHVLVVDDSVNIRRIVFDHLKKLGFQKVTTADDATDAYGKLNHFADSPTPVGLILSDLNMPGPSGLDFLKQVRGQERHKNLPFILVTTESEKGAVIQAAVAGVSAYIVKPFNIETLSRRLQEAWKKHNA